LINRQGEPLPALIDCKGIMEELGIKRAAAEAIMRQLPKTTIDGHRRVYVYRADVERYLSERRVAA